MTSGGSTGRPKLIVSATPAIWNPEQDYLQMWIGGSVLVPGPLYHNGPFMWAMIALFKGNRVTITTRFDAESTLRLIEEQQVELLYLVPTMMQRIWSLPEAVRHRYALGSLKVLWHSGSALSALAEGGLHRLARRGRDLGALRRHRRPRRDGHHRCGVACAPGQASASRTPAAG